VEHNVADYIWVTPAERLADWSGLCPVGPRKPMVGIRLETLDSGKGVLIVDVMTKSPAERAGIKPQDILVAIDGNPVSRLSDLHNAIAGSKKASTFLFKIDRQGKLIELTVRIKRTDSTT
jgi:S1-C subfamily serine protease